MFCFLNRHVKERFKKTLSIRLVLAFQKEFTTLLSDHKSRMPSLVVQFSALKNMTREISKGECSCLFVRSQFVQSVWSLKLCVHF